MSFSVTQIRTVLWLGCGQVMPATLSMFLDIICLTVIKGGLFGPGRGTCSTECYSSVVS